MPPHLTAQTLASQPVTRPQPLPAPTGQDGFEALTLKSASPAKIIVAKQVEQREPATQSAPAQPATSQNLQSAIDELTRRSRPGSRLDIRV